MTKLIYLVVLLAIWRINCKSIIDDKKNVENSSVGLEAAAERFEGSGVELKWIKPEDLVELLFYLRSDANIKKPIVIDTRSSNEFNGWKHMNANETNPKTGLFSLYDENNGHLIDSFNFDSSWIDRLDPSQLVEHVSSQFGLRTKNSDESNSTELTTLILYGNTQENVEKVKNFLMDKFSINRVYLSEIKSKEISSYLKQNGTSSLFSQEPFYDMLISPEALTSILRPYQKNDEIYVNPIADYKLIDVSEFESEKYYQDSHIPSAVYLSTNELEEKPLRLVKNRTKLARVLLDLGIKPNNTEMVILYGNPDQAASFRAAVVFKYMGVRDVKVLNGGYRSWLLKKDYLTQNNSNERKPIQEEIETKVKEFEEQSIRNQSPINYLVDFNYVNDLVQNMEIFSDQYSLVDLRSKEEFLNARIPGSIWAHGDAKPNQLAFYHNPDLTMRSGNEIFKMWDELGIDYKNKHLIFYCENGWSSSEIMFYAELMGLYRISVYDGGFNEWSNESNNTIESGENEIITYADFNDETTGIFQTSTAVSRSEETTCETTEAETVTTQITSTTAQNLITTSLKNDLTTRRKYLNSQPNLRPNVLFILFVVLNFFLF